jgi:hypothetical protein
MLKGSSKNSIGLDWISGNKNEKLASENADTPAPVGIMN